MQEQTKELRYLVSEMMEKTEKGIAVCNTKIQHLSHPEIYGCCLSRCNSIVINKERMMTVTTDKNHLTTYEWAPLYPTYFTHETAEFIVKEDIYRDMNGNRIKMEIINEIEYYKLLKAYFEKSIETWKAIF